MPRPKPVESPPTALARWLRDHKRSQAWLAQRFGVSIVTASRWVRGIAMPRPEVALKIQSLTGITTTVMAQAKVKANPANRAARIRYAKELIQRGSSMLAEASEEVVP